MSPARPRVLQPPPITLECDCGEHAAVGYGERWTCPACGRAYDTSHIPAAEYQAIERAVRRYRTVALVAVALVAALVLALALSNRPLQVVLVLPAVLLIWFLYVRPLLRRPLRKALAGASSWQLRAEPRERE